MPPSLGQDEFGSKIWKFIYYFWYVIHVCEIDPEHLEQCDAQILNTIEMSVKLDNTH